MKIRPLLLLTAIASSILGAVVVYLVLSVPNDLRADALMKDARAAIQKNDNAKARESLKKIVQQYPRTDAAAAATVALDSLAQKERDDLARAIVLLRRQNEQQTATLTTLQKSIDEMKAAPAPAPVTVTAPAPAPAKKTTTTKKKSAPAKKTTTKKRRR